MDDLAKKAIKLVTDGSVNADDWLGATGIADIDAHE
jgi:hypothetical protein